MLIPATKRGHLIGNLMEFIPEWIAEHVLSLWALLLLLALLAGDLAWQHN